MLSGRLAKLGPIWYLISPFSLHSFLLLSTPLNIYQFPKKSISYSKSENEMLKYTPKYLQYPILRPNDALQGWVGFKEHWFPWIVQKAHFRGRKGLRWSGSDHMTPEPPTSITPTNTKYFHKHARHEIVIIIKIMSHFWAPRWSWSSWWF